MFMHGVVEPETVKVAQAQVPLAVSSVEAFTATGCGPLFIPGEPCVPTQQEDGPLVHGTPSARARLASASSSASSGVRMATRAAAHASTPPITS